MFSSSRTLPGQWYRSSAASAPEDEVSHRFAELSRVLRQEVAGQRRHVFPPLAERGHGDWHHVEPVEEVLPEPARPPPPAAGLRWWRRRSGRRPGWRGSPPTRSISRSWRARRSLGWRSSRSDPDLVQEQRPGVRHLELPELPRVRARERAPLVTEQLRLQQLGRERRAVHGHEGPVAAAALPVDGARDQLLAGARLPRDEHGGRGVGDLADKLVDAAHRRRPADQLIEAPRGARARRGGTAPPAGAHAAPGRGSPLLASRPPRRAWSGSRRRRASSPPPRSGRCGPR